MSAEAIQRAVHARLSAAVAAARPDYSPPADHADDPAGAATELIDALLAEVTDEYTWLTLTAIAAAFPSDETVLAVRRTLELTAPGLRAEVALRHGLRLLTERGNALAGLEMVTEQHVIDVTHCCSSDYHTGIQRVVRSTVPHWVERGHPIRLVSWTEGNGAYRGLTPAETSRVIHWGAEHPHATAPTSTVLVPWRTTVILPELMKAWQSLTLATVAERTGNRFVLIGYDCIPAVSAELLPGGAGDNFMPYLALVKHTDLVAGISSSATTEFAGLVYSLDTQGLSGPTVVECELPAEFPASARAGAVVRTSPPTITCVGSHEPRKNHLLLLAAAEQLWQEGLRFRLVMIGGGGWDIGGFEDLLELLKKKGRDVETPRALSDTEVRAAYRSSRFTVFPSIQEGYGLPVAESLVLGVPAITTNYGSTAEIAEDGGCLLIDPRSETDLTDAMRRLLTDDDLLAELTAQAAARPVRTWADYASELWARIEEVR